MASGMTVHVSGLRETRKAFEKGSDELKELDEELVRLAEPVRQTVDQKLARYERVGPVKVQRRGFEVVVRQTKRKVTGKRPDFGALQMRVAFIPALEQHRDRIERDVEQWLDKVFSTSDL